MKISADTLVLIRAEFGEFTISPVGHQLSIRFGFWEKISLYKLQDLLGSDVMVFEDEIDDDDCRTRWSYKLA